MKTKLTLIAAIFSCSVALDCDAQTDLVAKNNIPQRVDLTKEMTSTSPVFFSNNNTTTIYAREKSIEHWKRLKRMGIITTSVGVASFVGGVAMIASEASDPYYDENDPGPTATAGALGIIGSVPAVLGGLTMWIIGGVNNAKMKNKGVSFTNTKNGAGLVYKF